MENKALEIVANGYHYVQVLLELEVLTLDQQSDVFAAYVNGACQYAGVTADEIQAVVESLPNRVN